MSLFEEFKVDVSKLELSAFKKAAPKKVVEKVKAVKRFSKVASGDVPPFFSEEERLKHFPNPKPMSLKELKNRKCTISTRTK